ncbi:uncharacterized protein FIBRA_01891 [Fibroporia radiculosa]|uniref:Fatty acid desaturase domain-containing protein n=1 Tax=Fibroporia radiculosa TaxID=599839 RepID=J4I8R4_9APHY|nr:uncharacterized protein FIBRA_01891 [Fibroporia radiculosa]CCL99866.1 predicted protein [Fibroporia radiculosa]
MFSDSLEYEERVCKSFVAPNITYKEVRDSVPKHLLVKNAWVSTYYYVRDIGCCIAFFYFAASIEWIVTSGICDYIPLLGLVKMRLVKGLLWVTYWWMQGLAFSSFFFLGHELGHQSLYNSGYANDILGYFLHSFILSPFFAWKSSHNTHHRTVGSVERDVNYVPHGRSRYNLPPRAQSTTKDFLDVFDEAPIFTLMRLLFMQFAGWWLYLTINSMGCKKYLNSSHFSPRSPIFRPDERMGIVLSDLGVLGMGYVLYCMIGMYGLKTVTAYYFIPFMVRMLLIGYCGLNLRVLRTVLQSLVSGLRFVNQWNAPMNLLDFIRIVMVTFLQHSDPTVPHYRKQEWTWIRGAIATIDRPLLGGMGRFFMHNVVHCHVAHHLFAHAPFYNLPEITECIRGVLKDHYVYDSTNSFYALYRSFTQCLFIEDEDVIAFYKNKYGESVREAESQSKVSDKQCKQE